MQVRKQQLEVDMDMNLSKLWEIVEDRKSWYTVVFVVAKSQTGFSDLTTT